MDQLRALFWPVLRVFWTFSTWRAVYSASRTSCDQSARGQRQVDKHFTEQSSKVSARDGMTLDVWNFRADPSFADFSAVAQFAPLLFSAWWSPTQVLSNAQDGNRGMKWTAIVAASGWKLRKCQFFFFSKVTSKILWTTIAGFIQTGFLCWSRLLWVGKLDFVKVIFKACSSKSLHVASEFQFSKNSLRLLFPWTQNPRVNQSEKCEIFEMLRPIWGIQNPSMTI